MPSQMKVSNPERVVRRAIYLASVAAANNEEQVWEQVSKTVSPHGRPTPPGQEPTKVTTACISAETKPLYVALYYATDGMITFEDAAVVQAWSKTYPTMQALLDAAIESLAKEATVPPVA